MRTVGWSGLISNGFQENQKSHRLWYKTIFGALRSHSRFEHCVMFKPAMTSMREGCLMAQPQGVKTRPALNRLD